MLLYGWYVSYQEYEGCKTQKYHEPFPSEAYEKCSQANQRKHKASLFMHISFNLNANVQNHSDITKTITANTAKKGRTHVLPFYSSAPRRIFYIFGITFL